MPTAVELRSLLFEGFIRAEGTTLRREDEKKCLELEGFLSELTRAFTRTKRTNETLAVVDAAAGKGYVGLFVAKLPAVRAARPVRVTLLERDPARVEHIRAASQALAIDEESVDARVANVSDAAQWPHEPHLVASLHACGDASDHVIARAAAARARTIVVAPCCVASHLPAAVRAAERAESLGLGGLAEVRRRFIEAEVLGARALALEAAGYRVESVAFVGPSVTPYNVALRALRENDPVRIARARKALDALSVRSTTSH